MITSTLGTWSTEIRRIGQGSQSGTRSPASHVTYTTLDAEDEAVDEAVDEEAEAEAEAEVEAAVGRFRRDGRSSLVKRKGAR